MRSSCVVWPSTTRRSSSRPWPSTPHGDLGRDEAPAEPQGPRPGPPGGDAGHGGGARLLPVDRGRAPGRRRDHRGDHRHHDRGGPDHRDRPGGAGHPDIALPIGYDLDAAFEELDGARRGPDRRRPCPPWRRRAGACAQLRGPQGLLDGGQLGRRWPGGRRPRGRSGPGRRGSRGPWPRTARGRRWRRSSCRPASGRRWSGCATARPRGRWPPWTRPGRASRAPGPAGRAQSGRRRRCRG